MTEQLVGLLAPTSVQLAAGEKFPALLVAKLTVPVGAVGVALVSVTVAVQVVEPFTVTEEGAQLTLVVVGCTGGGAVVKQIVTSFSTGVCVVSVVVSWA